MQININSIKNKLADLEQLITKDRPDILTIQETTLKTNDKTPILRGYTASRKDGRQNDRGLLTYITQDIKFTDIQTDTPDKTELQLTKLHISPTKYLFIANTYIHPRTEEIAVDDDKTENLFRQILRHDNTIITGDVNAHLKHVVFPDDRPQRRPNSKYH